MGRPPANIDADKEPRNYLTLNEYQRLTKRTAIYPGAHTGNNNAITYVVLGATGEAGELANSWKKAIRDGDSTVAREKLRWELGDVLWYVSQLATELGTTLESIAESNLQKLADRQLRNKLQGSGDNR